MKITLVTPTCDRPEAFELCEKWMARQTLPYYQWVVLDDGVNPAPCTMKQSVIRFGEETRGRQSLARKLCYFAKHLDNIVTGDIIAFIEDDDWYKANYLEVTAQRIAQGYDIVGEMQSIYYNVRNSGYVVLENTFNSSLCQTSITRKCSSELARLAADDDPYLDWRLWLYSDASLKRKAFEHNGARTSIGIKGIYQGYTQNHCTDCSHPGLDSERTILAQLIGEEDAKAYSRFKQLL